MWKKKLVIDTVVCLTQGTALILYDVNDALRSVVFGRRIILYIRLVLLEVVLYFVLYFSHFSFKLRDSSSRLLFWFWYEHTPARPVWQNMNRKPEQVRLLDSRSPRPSERVKQVKAKLKTIMPIVVPDVCLQAIVLILFSFSTGVYLKRLDSYLRMTGSGQVASVRGIGIQNQALESNAGRRGGL